MNHSEIFSECRPLLFSIAYRMLGSVMAAEDIVQDAYLRWQHVDHDEVDSPKAYLSTIVTRLCIDHLRSARIEREEYVGPWLPEPVVAGRHPDALPDSQPADNLALAESLSMAFLVLLESLSPTQRAVFLLHDVFDYTYAEIADIVGESPANCRKLGSRARKYVEERRPRFDPEPAQQEELVQRFWRACTEGDMSMLLSTLKDDITAWSDGGGMVVSARKPIHGADNVARFLLGIVRQAPETLRVERATVNGQPAFLSHIDGDLYGVMVLNVVDDAITETYMILNPEKLQAIT